MDEKTFSQIFIPWSTEKEIAVFKSVIFYGSRPGAYGQSIAAGLKFFLEGVRPFSRPVVVFADMDQL